MLLASTSLKICYNSDIFELSIDHFEVIFSNQMPFSLICLIFAFEAMNDTIFQVLISFSCIHPSKYQAVLPSSHTIAHSPTPLFSAVPMSFGGFSGKHHASHSR